jgi:hypothetical protein
MKRILVVLVLLAVAGFAFAQIDTDAHNVVITIAPIAAIALDDTVDVTFTTSAPALAGDPPGPTVLAPATDVSKYLFYTAANLGAAERTITVTTSANAPAGTALTVEAVVAAGAGTDQGVIDIDTAGSYLLIDAIPSVATGRDGPGGDGAALTYSFWVATPASLVVGALPTTIIVTYTLTEDL